MSALSRIFKELAEANAGRIRFFPSIYEYVYMNDANDPDELLEKFPSMTGSAMTIWLDDAPRVMWRNEKNSNIAIERDEKRTDRVIMLRSGESKRCWHPEIHAQNDPFVDQHGAAWVKKSVCQKCEHYRKRNDPRNRYNFPVCAHPERETGPTPADIVSEAVKTTNEILGKS